MRSFLVGLTVAATLAACGGDIHTERTTVTTAVNHARPAGIATRPGTRSRPSSRPVARTHVERRHQPNKTSPPPVASLDYHLWPDWPTWHCIGRNEQGAATGGPYDSNGDGIAWHGSPAGGEPGSGYPGGLGIMRAAWDDARGQAGVWVANGADATPADQIRVGRVIVARHGWRAWAIETLRKCGLA